MICQTCKHHPGIGHLCTTGHRHATAAPKHCNSYSNDPKRISVFELRSIAIGHLRADDQNGYAQTLKTAHKEVSQ